MKEKLQTRKDFLTFTAKTLGIGAGVLTLPGSQAFASKTQLSQQDSATSYLIKNANIISMDAGIGNLPDGDILIREGKIVSVQKSIIDNRATVINGKGMVVLPGFVETHWHIWTSLMRALAGSKPGLPYFKLATTMGPLYSPENTYDSTRLALAEAISSGITHVHDWSHNIIDQHYAEASLKAIKESGIRSRFSLGVAAGKDDIDLSILQQLKNNWSKYDNNGLISLGLAWPGTTKNLETRRREVITARKLGLPISFHAGRNKDNSDTVQQVLDLGLLEKDMQIVHGINTTKAEYTSIAKAGASVSVSPFSELRIGYGLPPATDMINSGAALGFSVDTTPLSGNADMFAIMKIFTNLATGMSRDEFQITAQRVLEIATIEGARSLGIDQLTGSLTPGKFADLQMINTNAINIGVVTDPVQLITLSAQPSNVDTVMANGKILKRNGQLTYTDIHEVITSARTSLKDLMSRS